jgi:hypothetical protein
MIISEFELTLRNSLTLACVRILAYSQFLIIALWALLDRFESFRLVVYYQLYPEEEELQGFVAPWGNSNSCTSWPASCFRCRTGPLRWHCINSVWRGELRATFRLASNSKEYISRRLIHYPYQSGYERRNQVRLEERRPQRPTGAWSRERWKRE